MTISGYRRTFPDFDQPDERIEECLIRAKLIINDLTDGKAGISKAPVQRAIYAQTYELLKHYEDEPQDCDELSRIALITLHKSGILKETV